MIAHVVVNPTTIWSRLRPHRHDITAFWRQLLYTFFLIIIFYLKTMSRHRDKTLITRYEAYCEAMTSLPPNYQLSFAKCRPPGRKDLLVFRQQIHSFVEYMKNLNTKRKTNSDITIFKECTQRSKTAESNWETEFRSIPCSFLALSTIQKERRIWTMNIYRICDKISISGLLSLDRYRSLGMTTVLIWKMACLNL